MTAAVFAACFAALYTAHQVADHWLQTPAQAAGKGGPGWTGRLACARHVATLTLTAFGFEQDSDEAKGLHLLIGAIRRRAAAEVTP
jgi:hypothetical protein